MERWVVSPRKVVRVVGDPQPREVLTKREKAC